MHHPLEDAALQTFSGFQIYGNFGKLMMTSKSNIIKCLENASYVDPEVQICGILDCKWVWEMKANHADGSLLPTTCLDPRRPASQGGEGGTKGRSLPLPSLPCLAQPLSSLALRC